MNGTKVKCVFCQRYSNYDLNETDGWFTCSYCGKTYQASNAEEAESGPAFEQAQLKKLLASLVSE